MDGVCTNPDNSPEKKRTDFKGEINKKLESGEMMSQKRIAKAGALRYKRDQSRLRVTHKQESGTRKDQEEKRDNRGINWA